MTLDSHGMPTFVNSRSTPNNSVAITLVVMSTLRTMMLRLI